jgi:hypothetical protein
LPDVDQLSFLSDFEEYTSSDKEFSAIFSTCIADPDRCILARRNKTAIELEQAVWSLIDTIKFRPIPIGNFKLDYSTLKAIIVDSLYSTFSWPRLTLLLDLLLAGNINDALPVIKSFLVQTDADKQMVNAVFGIHCSDRTTRTSSFDDFMPAIDRLYNTSKFMGDIQPYTSMTCAQWKMEAKERYNGDFHVQTKNPVLLVGNTYDAFTPVVSAYNVSSGFKDSVVLEINGHGVSNHSPRTTVLR